jgi:hypothetical protein
MNHKAEGCTSIDRLRKWTSQAVEKQNVEATYYLRKEILQNKIKGVSWNVKK